MPGILSNSFREPLGIETFDAGTSEYLVKPLRRAAIN